MNMSHRPLLPESSVLPLSIERVFRPLCEDLAPVNLPLLQTGVQAYLTQIAGALRSNEFIDAALAQAIGAVLLRLLGDYDSFAPEEQLLIVGAARYFIDPHDTEPDTESVLGFEDDLEVLNYVLDAIDHTHLKIEP
jgi:hypothetical protein